MRTLEDALWLKSLAGASRLSRVPVRVQLAKTRDAILDLISCLIDFERWMICCIPSVAPDHCLQVKSTNCTNGLCTKYVKMIGSYGPNLLKTSQHLPFPHFTFTS